MFKQKDQDQHKAKLCSVFRICALKGWDNWTYTHISLRHEEDAFLINRFGVLYHAVTPDDLVSISLNEPFEKHFGHVNPTGVLLHSTIYRKRPDIRAIFHLHTPYGVAVSMLEPGLLPISQYALHFYGQIARHSYDSLVLDETIQCEKVAEDLGDRFVMLLNNHGTLTTGTTLEEAFFFTHHLEEACRVQVLATSTKLPIIYPSHEVCVKANHDLLSFEKNRGQRDFKAALSLLDDNVKKQIGL